MGVALLELVLLVGELADPLDDLRIIHAATSSFGLGLHRRVDGSGPSAGNVRYRRSFGSDRPPS